MREKPDLSGCRRLLLRAITGAPFAAPIGAARAQAWPAKPIRIVSTSAPGGGSDVFSRPMAEFFSRELGVSCIVENRPGANGIVGHEAVVRQPPDGYTLLISYPAAVIANKLMLAKMSHDPIADFVPIGRIGGGGGNVLVVNPELPVRNVKELVEYSKTRSGTLTYASWGIASGGHLIMEMIKSRTGLQATHVPYKAGAQIPPDVISGVVPVAWIDSGSVTPHVRSGKLRAIAVAAQRHLPQIPEADTLGEQGIAWEVQTWYGLFAPKGTPAPVVARLNQVLNRWLVLPETAAFFEQKQNSPAPVPTTPEEFAAVLQSDLAAWKRLLAEARVTP